MKNEFFMDFLYYVADEYDYPRIVATNAAHAFMRSNSCNDYLIALKECDPNYFKTIRRVGAKAEEFLTTAWKVLNKGEANMNYTEYDLDEEIKDFDVMQYALEEDYYDLIDEKSYAIEMGRARNLMTALIDKGATKEEMVRVLKYSMVVIDSLKKHLDFCEAFRDFKIRELKEKYGLYHKR